MAKITLRLPGPHSVNQRTVMKAFETKHLIEMWIAAGSKWGKAESLQTLIPTPTGWKKLGELFEGDFVFDENGKPTLIEYATDPMYNHDCYEVVFSDGQKVVADAEHLWVTTTHLERKNISRVKSKNDRTKSTTSKPQIRTTKEILDTLLIDMGGKKRPNHAIPLVAGPLQFEEQDLPIDPYVLGVWLGDGSLNSRNITLNDNHKDIIIGQLNNRGFVRTHSLPSYAITHSFTNLREGLKLAGVLKNKHVPEKYLVASPSQRLDLLQGLMDTDGTICKRGHCCFDNTNKNIADAVESLCISHGIKVMREQRIGKLYGVEKKLCYRVKFTTDIPVFTVEQKLQRIKEVNSKSKLRYIKQVNRVKSEPVKCIRVKSKNHLFLCGKGCIPTHNTVGLSVALQNVAAKRYGNVFRWIAPNYAQSKIGMRYNVKLAPPPPYTRENNADMCLTYPYSGNTRVEFRTGNDPEALEGEATNGNIIDEASKCKEQVYSSVKTTTSVTRGPIIGISTPRGKNWFYKKCMDAQDRMLWCIKNNKPLTHVFITAPTSDNPMVTQETIDEAKRSLSDRLFRQYFEAEFVDDGNVFVNVQSCVQGEILLDVGQHFEEWFADDFAKCHVVVGADWAKTKDWTVFIAIDYRGRKPRIVGFKRFQELAYTEQIKQLYYFCNKFERVETCWHDKTGVGMAVDDMLVQTPMPTRGIVFSNTSKTSMVNQLMLRFEGNSIEIPWWPTLVKELDLYELKTTRLGAYQFNAPNGEHDDTVCALMLAVAAYEETATPFEFRWLEDLPKTEIITLDTFYDDMLIDME